MKKIYYPFLVLVIFSIQLKSQNNCLNFDGSNDYVAISSFNFNGYSSITFEAWVYSRSFNSLSPDDYISNVVGHYDASALLRIGDNDGSHMQDNNRAQFAINTSNGTDKCNSTTEMSINTWYHIACTYDGSNLKIYVNGILEDTEPHTGTISTSLTNIALGGDDNSIFRMFDGLMDEVRIWSDARTESEIRANMYKELVGNEANLVAYYKFNETSGTNADNAEGTASKDGTLNNMAGTEWLTSSAFFGPKNCLDFDGTNDYIAITNNSGLQPTSAFTVESWVNVNSTVDYSNIIDNGFATADLVNKCGGFVLGINNSTTKLFRAWICTGSNYPADRTVVTSDMEYEEDKWYHVVTVYTGSALNLYVNGKLVGSESVSGTIDYTYVNNSSSYGLNIGRFNDDNETYCFNGFIDEVRIWNIARTEAQIRNNMCKTLVGNEIGLVGYYNFDNLLGITLQDFSGNGNNGSLNNMDNSDWITSASFNTWLNTLSTSWTTDANWSRSSKPDLYDNLGIYSYSGGNSPSFGIADEAVCNNVVINLSSDWLIGGSFDVNSNIILESNLDLNGQRLYLAESAKLIESNGFVLGTSGKIETQRTLSNINEDVAGMGVEISSTQNMGTTTVERYTTAITGPGGDKGINRYYKISPTTNTGLNATLVFNYDDSELNGSTENNLVLFKSINDGLSWTQVGGTVSSTNNTITLSSIDGFSWWTAAESGSVLPIKLLNFSSKCLNKNSIELNWATASEINNSHFEIQQSLDAENFITIGKVEGAGNSNSILNYKSIVENNENIQSYFRLKQIDFDGKFEYSKIIAVDCSDNLLNTIEVYPNPFTNEISIDFKTLLKSKVKIEVRNKLGIIIKEEVIEANNSNKKIELNKNLSSGIYFIIISNDTETIVRKLLKE